MNDRSDYIDEVFRSASMDFDFLIKQAIENAKGEGNTLLPYWLGEVAAYEMSKKILEYVAVLVVNSENPEDRKEYDL